MYIVKPLNMTPQGQKELADITFTFEEDALAEAAKHGNARVYHWDEYTHRVKGGKVGRVIHGYSPFDHTNISGDESESHATNRAERTVAANYQAIAAGQSKSFYDRITALEWIASMGGTGRVLNSAGAPLIGVKNGKEHHVPCYTVSRWEKNKAGNVSDYHLREGYPVNVEREHTAEFTTHGVIL